MQEGTLAAPASGAYVEIDTMGGKTSFAYPKQQVSDADAASPGFSPPKLHHINIVSRVPSDLHEFYTRVLCMDSLSPDNFKVTLHDTIFTPSHIVLPI